MWTLSKNPPKTYTPNKGQKKSTVQAIEELRRNREERRRNAEEYRKNRAADKLLHVNVMHVRRVVVSFIVVYIYRLLKGGCHREAKKI